MIDWEREYAKEVVIDPDNPFSVHCRTCGKETDPDGKMAVHLARSFGVCERCWDGPPPTIRCEYLRPGGACMIRHHWRTYAKIAVLGVGFSILYGAALDLIREVL